MVVPCGNLSNTEREQCPAGAGRVVVVVSTSIAMAI